MWLGLFVETVKFVILVLKWIHTNYVASSREYNNSTAVLGAFLSGVHIYIKLLFVSSETQGVFILDNVVENFIMSATEKNLKKAAGLSSAEQNSRKCLVHSRPLTLSILRLK